MKKIERRDMLSSYFPDDELINIAREIIKTGKSHKLTPKKLLEHFGTTRRKTHVVWWIDKGLDDLGIRSDPDFKFEYLYGEIELKKAVKKKESAIIENDAFIQRLKLLKSANKTPIFVTKNDTISKAMTLMVTNDYSQLPVMNSESAKSVDGVISWHSIGWSTATGKKVEKVGDCMNKDFTILKYETPILDAVKIIKEKEFVLIQRNDKTISGLVTITDIADEFFTLAEPFLYIGQIETSIRVLLEGKFTIEELSEVKFGEDTREIHSVSDLTFNEYIQLLRKGDNWKKIGLPLDMKEFTKKLEEIRNIRNDVMHFSSDELDESQEQNLKQTAQFLKEILK